MFSRGDTTHTNQNGTLMARERSTSIRYLAAEAERRGMYKAQVPPMRRWTQPELLEVEKVRHEWIMSNRLGISPHFEEVGIGDRLPRRALGPHTLASFATEYRAFLFNVWGSFQWVAPPGMKDRGSTRIRVGSKGSALTRTASKSIRASATVCIWAPPAVMLT